MKKLISAALSCAILVSATTCNMTSYAAFSGAEVSSSKTATSGTCGENVTWTLDNGTLTISGTGDMEVLAFSTPPWGFRGFNKVVIEEGVTSIAPTAFNGSTITEIEIADSVTSIGKFAFMGCSMLTEVTLPSNLKELSLYAFNDCSALTSVTIPASVTSIGNGPFYGCTSMTEIIVEEGNANYVSVDGVLYTKDMTKLVSYPTGKVGTEFVIPDSVTEIGGGAFGCNSNLVSVIIPDSVTAIYGEAFSNCNGIKSITLPKSVGFVDEYAFMECANLESITIENPECEFFDASYTICNSAEFSDTPDVKYDGTYAGTIYGYEGSTAQQHAEKYGREFVSLGEAPTISIIASGTCGENVTWTLDDEGTLTISGTGPMVTTYFGSPEWDRDENGQRTTINKVVIEEGVTSISGTAFNGCAMTEIEIADSVTSIGNFAFLSCENLTEITLPKNLTEISLYAFCYCYSLENIIIPASVTAIGNGAFFGCDSMTEIIVEEGNADYISVDGVLYTKDMTKLVGYPTGKTDTDYTIADGVTEIVGGSFGSNDNLVNVVIPDTVTTIIGGAFDSCSKIEEIIIPESVTYIDEYVFRGCESLKSVVFENPDCVIYDASHTICNTYESVADSSIKYIGTYTGTIYGYEGSTAQQHAEKYGFAFEALEEKEYTLGDADGNGTIDPVDATLVLRQYSLASMNADDLLNDAQKIAADANSDSTIDPVDATLILRYYSYASMNGTDTFEEFIK